MNRRKVALLAGAVALILALGASAVAAGRLFMGSADYGIPWSTFSAGGGALSSPGYRMLGSLGGLNGGTSSGNYAANGGVWQPVAAPAVTIAGGPDLGVALSWTAIAADAGGYQVWWSTQPYFQPGDADANFSLQGAGSTGLSRPGSGGVNYTYVVQGINGVGQASGNSNRTGQFLFGLARGG